MAYSRLGAVLIVKDEAANISACLASMAEIVSEFVVYDTGSTDGTQELADRAGGRVVQGEWRDDFGWARNQALIGSSTEWVLSVDADERVVADSRALLELLEQATARGVDVLGVTIVNRGPAGQGDHTHVGGRLLRRQQVLWSGALHEHPIRRDGKPLVSATAPESALRLEHFGYTDPDVLRLKSLRNRDIAERSLQRALGIGVSRNELASTWLAVGKTRAACGDVEGAGEAFLAACTDHPGTPQAERATEAMIALHLSAGRPELVPDLVASLRVDPLQTGYRDWQLVQAWVHLDRTQAALDLVRRIDRLIDLDGCTYDMGPVREMHAHLAIRCGQVDEGIAALVQAMTRHGRICGRGALLMRLWGDRPVAVLATLLAEFGPADPNALIRELATVEGPGEAVALALAGRVEGAAVTA